MRSSKRQQGLHHVLEHDARGMRAEEREDPRGLPGGAACEVHDEVQQARDEEGEEEGEVASEEGPPAGA
jgi:hypothetical protein